MSTKTICLEDQVHDVIKHNPYLSKRELTCVAQEGRVILSGNVGTYFQKQMAQEALRGVEGVDQIDNRLQVES